MKALWSKTPNFQENINYDANKIWAKTSEDNLHMLKDGSTIVINTLTMGGNEYKASVSADKQKFIDDF